MKPHRVYGQYKLRIYISTRFICLFIKMERLISTLLEKYFHQKNRSCLFTQKYDIKVIPRTIHFSHKKTFRNIKEKTICISLNKLNCVSDKYCLIFKLSIRIQFLPNGMGTSVWEDTTAIFTLYGILCILQIFTPRKSRCLREVGNISMCMCT